MRNIRVATVQMQHAAGDKTANFAKMEAFAQRAAQAEAEILVLPECCITGYWFLRNLSREQLEGLAERVPEGEPSMGRRGLAHKDDLGPQMMAPAG